MKLRSYSSLAKIFRFWEDFLVVIPCSFSLPIAISRLSRGMINLSPLIEGRIVDDR
uniref:Uncharacterized protein n=1 Tax=Arundo donax TaxID=35708 RepID=A0A0A9E7S1_ARUDO